MAGPAPSHADQHSALTELAREFPFEVELSLAPLIRFWQGRIAGEDSLRGRLGRLLQAELGAAPELSEPIHDLGVLDRRRELVEALMAVVFAPAFWEHEYAAALIPFQLKSFYATPAFERDLKGDDGRLRGRLNVDMPTLAHFRLLNAYSLVLGRVYGIDFPVDYPLIFSVEDPSTGLDHHFKIHFDGRFMDVEPAGPVSPLTAEARERLLARSAGLDALPLLIPPGSYRFRGFTVFRALDVTDHEVLSSLKRDLIDKESIISQARFQGLQAKLRTLFRRRDLRLGLAAVEGDRVLMLNHGARLQHSCIFADSVHHKVSDFDGSIYMRASIERRPLFVEDLAAYPDRIPVEEAMLQNGLRNIVVSPLYYQEQMIGSLSLSSPNPGDFTALQAPKLQEVLPLFSMAVKRSLDELDGRVQAFIKEKCTAIHPVVEWRFRDFEKQRTDGVDYSIYAGSSLLEDGAFDPLYLKNLRLWQLMVACGIAIRTERLKDRLSVPLEVTSLILVQHAPLAIRFRFDEKRFDVDGAYNVRYEIIKKRIDKAVIHHTTERLTQPGKIALVYSHVSEALEWRDYIEYLQNLGYLTPHLEELELEELAGAQGLHALRVTVNLAHHDPDAHDLLSALTGDTRAITGA